MRAGPSQVSSLSEQVPEGKGTSLLKANYKTSQNATLKGL